MDLMTRQIQLENVPTGQAIRKPSIIPISSCNDVIKIVVRLCSSALVAQSGINQGVTETQLLEVSDAV
ncbi:hypothetical protein BCR33DRAFT_715976 [Rhizoclosmatium globosum]|uniref:Uncharacterized protein n=1 Tax=Rhizoclosmatium globosum TaxID=329046 RepID=A0A1Y2CGC2_9FUNG|nr:hypothetical protein BCR33DRAFT_715976 [Rhizoclosmatium globosum]|eukprot:ORY45957.1 hypothetical protein BCR33DRAFT_715976 [Rhizoclosmatium globosum]